MRFKFDGWNVGVVHICTTLQIALETQAKLGLNGPITQTK